MKRALTMSIAAGAVTAVSSGALAAVSSEAPAAQPAIQSITVRPGLAVQTAKSSQPIRFQVRASDAERVWVKVTSSNGAYSVVVDDLRETSIGVWDGQGLLFNELPAGTHKVQVGAVNDVGQEVTGNSGFQVRRNTYVKGFNAGPEPVRKGKKVSVSGRLMRFTPDVAVNYSGYGGAKVVIYFKKKGSGAWTYMGSATTARNGSFLKKYTARATGTWQARFNGAGIYYKTTADDAVKVK